MNRMIAATGRARGAPPSLFLKVTAVAAALAVIVGACSSTPASQSPASQAPASAAQTGAASAPASPAASVAGPTGARATTLIVGTPMLSEGRWDPAVGFEDIYRVVLKASYDTLVTFKGNDFATFVPDAAASWTVSPDATTFTFKLNPAVTFNSGNPMTSADVKFTYERLGNLAG